MELIRTAYLTDAKEISEIYRPYVLETPVTFELKPPSPEEIQSRISERQGKFPWLVYESGKQIVGYAYAGRFNARPAYSWSVESSVYVKRDFQGKGIGRELYRKLLDVLKDQGVVNVIGGMTLPNEASRKLHEQFGFINVAKYKDAGFKLGHWWDVGYWQLQFEKPAQPSELRAPAIL